MTERYQQITLEDYRISSLREKIRQDQEQLRAMVREERDRKVAERKLKEERDVKFAEVTLDIVASHYGVTVDQLTCPKRSKEFKQPRNTAQYIIYNGTDLSLLKISELVGRTDHTTALHAINKVESRLQFDEEFKGRIEGLKEEIGKQMIVRFYLLTPKQ